MVRLFHTTTIAGGTRGGKAIYQQSHIPAGITREIGWKPGDIISWLYESDTEKLLAEIQQLLRQGHQLVIVKKEGGT